MFTELILKNFKCYRDTGPVRLKPLTLLIGPNNAGKSTLLQAILMMKQTYEDRDVGEPLITSGPFVDLGAFQDILRGGRQASRRTLYI
ncbi:MAG: AAA family ATPase, partial [Actinomycetota bacterium]